jgi:hypothetical protein
MSEIVSPPPEGLPPRPTLEQRIDRLTVALLSALAILHIAAAAFDFRLFAYFGAFCFIAYIGLILPSITKREAPLMIGALLAVLATVSLHDRAGPVLIEALTKGTGYASLILALGFLQAPAAASQLVRNCGSYLIHQGPGRRYAALTGGAHLFGVVLNLGTLQLLGAMVKQSNTLEAAGGDAEVVQIRSRRMVTAMLRGFAPVTLWAPTSLTIAVALDIVPGVSWNQYLPLGLGMAVGYMALGWLMDRIRYSKRTRFRAQVSETSLTARQTLLPMVGLVAIILALVVLLKQGLNWPLGTAVMVATPLFSAFWLLQQGLQRDPRSALTRTVVQLAHHCAERMPKSRFEVISLTCAGVMGGAIGALIPPSAIAHIMEVWGLPPAVLLMVMSAIIVVVAQFGFNPVVAVTLLGSAVAQMHPIPVPPLALLVTLVGSWNMFGLSSPFSATTLILGTQFAENSRVIGHQWNGLFAIICFTALQIIIVTATLLA